MDEGTVVLQVTKEEQDPIHQIRILADHVVGGSAKNIALKLRYEIKRIMSASVSLQSTKDCRDRSAQHISRFTR